MSFHGAPNVKIKDQTHYYTLVLELVFRDKELVDANKLPLCRRQTHELK